MSSMLHFTHPGHPLTLTAGAAQQYYVCNGCKTPGTGKRFRCHGCDFDLHEFCSTCPHTLRSFLHEQHTLSLCVMGDNVDVGAWPVICNVCRDPVAGLSYRCETCRFYVHPLCTRLPEKLPHALHCAHGLRLEFPWRGFGVCGVCRGVCDGWRYRCGVCHFDVHIGCAATPQPKTGRRKLRGFRLFSGRVPFQGPSQFASYYPDGHYPPGPGYPHHHYAHPNNVNNNQMGRIGNIMFSLVQQLGLGAVSNMFFGMESPVLFSG